MHRRNMLGAVEAALSDSPVVLIHGARQVGKTTLVRDQVAGEGRRYVTLDSAGVLAAATEDPEGFLAGYSGPVVIDEVQRAPGLFRAIKAMVDEDRRPGRFLLTGSANVLMLPALSESLAGRMEIIQLWPLSRGEIEGRREGFIDGAFGERLELPERSSLTTRDVLALVVRGGFPEVIEREKPYRRAAWYDSYITTILQRDVRDLANIEDPAAMARLLRLLASRSAALLNYAEIARDLGLAQTTLKRYFALLETMFLVQTVRPWSANMGTRLVKSPKVCLLDTGLASHLLGIEELGTEVPALGGLLESFVVMELMKQRGWARTRAEIHHFRSQAGREVDVVLEDRRGRLVGIEVKAGATVRRDDFKGLRALADFSAERFHRGIVLYTGREAVPFGDRLLALPVDALWRL